MFHKSYRKNIGLLGATEFLSFFGVTSFWVLYLSQKGMTLFEIGILESIFHATSLISEVPSGMLADRFSYKSNLYLSRLANIISCLLMLGGNGNFWVYALGMIISAWAYNFDSGTSSAMLFESAKEAGLEAHFLKITSFLSAISEGTRALGLVVAGLLVHGLLDWTYIIHIILSLVVILLVFGMKEPSIKAEREKNPTLSAILTLVRDAFKQSPQLLSWLFGSQLLAVLMSMFYFYFQNEMTVLSSWQISAVMLVSSALNMGAVYLASRLGDKWPVKPLLYSLAGLVGLLYLLSGLKDIGLYVLVYLLTDCLYAFFLPIFNNDLQQQLDSQIRATMLSVNAMFFSLSMIVVFPLVGAMIDHFGFANSFMVLGSLLIGLALLFTFGKSRTVR